MSAAVTYLVSALRNCGAGTLRAMPVKALACSGLLVLAQLALGVATSNAYPLDAAEDTGIVRLRAYSLARDGKVEGATLYPGSLRPTSSVRLRLSDRGDFSVPSPDAALGEKLTELLGADAEHYGVAVLDVTDPAAPVYAEHQAGRLQNPGSVGKVVVALSLMQALADTYPDDIEARRRVLRETAVTADGFIRTDTHEVPFWTEGDARILKRPLREGDTANLWTYADWMCSNSSNAAAAMVMREALLLKKFGVDYPVDAATARTFFTETPKPAMHEYFLTAIEGPVVGNGLDSAGLRQGSFFTREGKMRVPGTSSHARARELMRFLVKMEQGRLVDAFSSLELKKLLYLTDRRIRYASSPALRDAAVYYKSGSLYSCRPEPDFKCFKYHGNVKNYMNSLAIVETSGRSPDLHYMAVLTSNVLRKNSAVAHQTFATRLHRIVESMHPERVAVENEEPVREVPAREVATPGK